MRDLERICEEKGLKLTEQRRLVLRVLSESTDHPTAEELYDRARSVEPRIHLATVYRTMRVLEEASIIVRHEFREGRSRYEEAVGAHHDHLIDVDSGEVLEFRNDTLERLIRSIAADLGYELVEHRIELYAKATRR